MNQVSPVQPHKPAQFPQTATALRRHALPLDAADCSVATLSPRAISSSNRAILDLVRADLQYNWEIGKPKLLVDYRRRYPDLFGDSDAAKILIAEEVRLRRQAGQNPQPSDYQEPFGPLPADWLQRLTAWEFDSSAPIDANAAAPSDEFATLHVTPSRFGPAPSALELAAEHAAKPPVSLLDVDVPMPKVGDEFVGFRLIGELGCGAFGHVYLAHQGDLANRPVVLKVSADLFQESQTLAQLHHPHVMPIYSLHQAGPLQAVCMPFLGTTTLADLLKDLKSKPSLPASGKVLVDTLHQRKSITRDRDEPSGPAQAANQFSISSLTSNANVAGEAVAARQDKVASALAKLEKCNYVEAVLWLGAQLADGLAHAHDRGILHRDLKPANILITEDGQPMLLDFNLSVDTKVVSPVAAARLGGTLPYMSPEQLRSFRGDNCPVDERSDLFSLGVILFEMLTERHPFRTHLGHAFATVPRMLEDRLQPPPDPRRENRAIPAAVAAILRKCLQPSPAERYQTAQQLKEDLEQQLAHRPLRHTHEPSLIERAQKWRRRHPRLVVAGTVACAVSLLILAPLGYLWQREQRLTHLARLTRDEFRADLKTVQGLLNAQNPLPKQRQQGIEHGRRWLTRYEVLDNPQWRALPAVRCLTPEDQARLDADVEELLILVARATALAAEQQEQGARAESLRSALKLNEVAQTNARAHGPTRALLMQRADLIRQLGQADQAERLAREAAAVELRSPRDFYLAATQHMAQRRFRDALPLLHRATQKDAQFFWAWFAQGLCHYELGEDAKALACYNACIALWPDSHDFHFYRGLVYHRQKRYPLAREEFDETVRLRPEWADAWLNRGVTQGQLGRHQDAIQDLNKAHALGSAPTRVYFLRALARERSGDIEGARHDRDVGLQEKPGDEVGWIARGLARLAKDPQGALSDFDEALKLNGRSFSALQNKAHVLADRLNKLNEALAILNRLVENYPDAVLARLGRGIVHARLGMHAEALDDAKESLACDVGASTLYHVANIYAITAGQRKENAPKALNLLAKALQSGYGSSMVAEDPDFAPLRDHAEFQRLVTAARTLGTAASQKN